MKNHKLHKIAALLLLFAAAASQIVGASKSSARLKRDAAKADYIFMEALRYSADDSLDAYSDLISRAYELNPADDYIAGEYGRFLLYVSYPDDMDRVNQGLGLMRKYVERNPSDYMSGIRLGRIFNQLNRNDDALRVYKLVYEKIPESPAAPTPRPSLTPTTTTASTRRSASWTASNPMPA